MLEQEQRLEQDVRAASARSRECRQTLQGVYARSAHRARELRTECFLGRSTAAPSPGPAPKQNGVLSLLREIYHGLDRLAAGYENAAAEGPRRRESYRKYAAECRADAQAVRRLLEKVLR